MQTLMELGGWSSYEMVLRYAHLAGDHLRAAAFARNQGDLHGFPARKESPAVKPRISMITLGVRNLDAAIEFYEKGLGFPRMDSPPEERPELVSNPVVATGPACGKARAGAGREDQD